MKMKKIPHHQTTHVQPVPEQLDPTNSPHFIAKYILIGMEYSFGQWVAAAPVVSSPNFLLTPYWWIVVKNRKGLGPIWISLSSNKNISVLPTVSPAVATVNKINSILAKT